MVYICKKKVVNVKNFGHMRNVLMIIQYLFTTIMEIMIANSLLKKIKDLYLILTKWRVGNQKIAQREWFGQNLIKNIFVNQLLRVLKNKFMYGKKISAFTGWKTVVISMRVVSVFMWST